MNKEQISKVKVYAGEMRYLSYEVSRRVSEITKQDRLRNGKIRYDVKVQLVLEDLT